MTTRSTAQAQTYHERVVQYENEGMTTSDAQGVVDAEMMMSKFSPRFDANNPMDSIKIF